MQGLIGLVHWSNHASVRWQRNNLCGVLFVVLYDFVFMVLYGVLFMAFCYVKFIVLSGVVLMMQSLVIFIVLYGFMVLRHCFHGLVRRSRCAALCSLCCAALFLCGIVFMVLHRFVFMMYGFTSSVCGVKSMGVVRLCILGVVRSHIHGIVWLFHFGIIGKCSFTLFGNFHLRVLFFGNQIRHTFSDSCLICALCR